METIQMRARRTRTRRFALPLISSGLAILLQFSCVTVNVHFPESDVQRATDEFVRELYRAKSKGKTPENETAPDEAAPKSSSSLARRLLLAAAEGATGLLPSASASDDVIHLDTSEAKRLKARMAERVEEILKFKRAGILGETHDGRLKIQGDPKLLRGAVEKLVQQENGDRAALYAEAVRSNAAVKLGAETVKRNFGRSFQSESPSGTWVQGADGNWAQKP